jgi:hypothetical protein
MTPTPTTTPTTPTIGPTPDVEAAGTSRSRGVAGRALAGMCVAVCGVWAFAPLESARVEAPELTVSSAAASEAAPRALDLSAFNAPLWFAPPPPPTKVAESASPPPPPPPLKWQLLAIVREGHALRALVYDPDADRVIVLGEGDQSGPRRIARVTPTSLDVRDEAGVRTLALRDAAQGGRP